MTLNFGQYKPVSKWQSLACYTIINSAVKSITDIWPSVPEMIAHRIDVQKIHFSKSKKQFEKRIFQPENPTLNHFSLPFMSNLLILS